MSELLQERYGGKSRGRRIGVIVATVLVAVAFGVWIAWAAWFHGSPTITAEVAAYDVAGTHRALVKVDARAADDTRGTCLIRATASDHTIVGELNLTVAEIRAQQGEWIPIRTERRATTVELVRCTVSGSSH